MEKNYDLLSTRLTQIIVWLNDGESLSVERLAEEFNVSSRTIQRDFSRLAILPIVKKDGVYKMASYALGKLSFSDIKRFAIFHNLTEIYPSFDENTILDILNHNISHIYKIKSKGIKNLSGSVDDFKVMGVAIAKKEEIAFIYKRVKRVVQPYKLLNNNHIWYLLGTEDGVLKHHIKIISPETLNEKLQNQLKNYLSSQNDITCLCEQVQ